MSHSIHEHGLGRELCYLILFLLYYNCCVQSIVVLFLNYHSIIVNYGVLEQTIVIVICCEVVGRLKIFKKKLCEMKYILFFHNSIVL